MWEPLPPVAALSDSLTALFQSVALPILRSFSPRVSTRLSRSARQKSEEIEWGGLGWDQKKGEGETRQSRMGCDNSWGVLSLKRWVCFSTRKAPRSGRVRCLLRSSEVYPPLGSGAWSRRISARVLLSTVRRFLSESDAQVSKTSRSGCGSSDPPYTDACMHY